MYEDCGICNAKVKQNDTSVICSGLCGKPYHNRCINLTAKDCQFILSLNNLKWFCENCLLSFNNYFEMNKKVEDLKKTMNVEMNKIYTAIKGSQLDQKSAQKTFAEWVSYNMPNRRGYNQNQKGSDQKIKELQRRNP
ncbi:hypothetical protein QE152_g11020 [Popillia japonica]|uniref:PHD-type domain-containing protein n=1 Tax=Popillia japonica TaxID=7064 RepID=A0AAW1LMP9_POPJA